MDSRHPIRIDFVELTPGGVAIDGHLILPGPPPRMHMFTIRADVPRSGWTALARWALSDWTSQDRELELELRQGRQAPQARISDGSMAVVLDVAAGRVVTEREGPPGALLSHVVANRRS